MRQSILSSTPGLKDTSTIDYWKIQQKKADACPGMVKVLADLWRRTSGPVCKPLLPLSQLSAWCKHETDCRLLKENSVCNQHVACYVTVADEALLDYKTRHWPLLPPEVRNHRMPKTSVPRHFKSVIHEDFLKESQGRWMTN